MRPSRFTKIQITDVLDKNEAGLWLGIVLHQHVIRKTSCDKWRAKHSGLDQSGLRRLIEHGVEICNNGLVKLKI